ncbi:MAG: Regulator protein FrmR [Candidatus Roizmanbacteria bacterium GW2011_GWA2_36_23]|uniref:Regulator protein FrmR n=1 Tax=Candidatus Roizmanbacteria bacterium GW2011_GWA2_36_23 TaxID=1618480 RepID=A0A0G0HCN5_9BACT|nr:MAG: Regulator protein FrmR [Candidatus Roizmanbacteria bacterium GW2011_GWA2_36_23]
MIGQLKGIERMVEKNRDCSDILQQVSAVKKAIDGLSKELVINGICKYIPKEEVQKVERMVERAINL